MPSEIVTDLIVPCLCKLWNNSCCLYVQWFQWCKLKLLEFCLTIYKPSKKGFEHLRVHLQIYNCIYKFIYNCFFIYKSIYKFIYKTLFTNPFTTHLQTYLQLIYMAARLPPVPSARCLLVLVSPLDIYLGSVYKYCIYISGIYIYILCTSTLYAIVDSSCLGVPFSILQSHF